MPIPTVALSAVRTPWGRVLGSLSDVSGPDLASLAVREALDRAGVAPGEVDHAWMGNVFADGTGGSPAGAACKAAGLSPGRPAFTLRMGCASGLAAVAAALESVAAGRCTVAVAGGFESTSMAPHLVHGLRRGLRLGGSTLRDAARQDGPVARDPAPGEDRDLRSGPRETGAPAGEIMSVAIPKPRKGQPSEITGDDPPPEAGPLPALADGAAALVVASAEWARERGLRPICLMEVADDPAAAAADHELIHADLPAEAWSALGWSDGGKGGGKMSPSGGGAILGHAAGADGARLAVSLVHALARGETGRGLALAGDPHGGVLGLAGTPWPE